MKKILLSLSLLLPLTAVAKTVDVEVVGYGRDIRSATKDALVSAIIQTNETSIKTQTQTSVSTRAKDEESTLNSKFDDDFRLESNGDIKQFTILEQGCKDDRCQVRLLAKVKVKKSAQLDELNRKLLTINHPVGRHSKAFNTELDARFVAGGKFAIFEENYASDDMDYILDLEVVKAVTAKRVVDNRKTDPMTGKITGQKSTGYSSVYEVKYKVKSAQSGQVKFMGTKTSTSGRNNLALLAQITAGKVYEDIHNAVFPMRIASVKHGIVTLSTSGKHIRKGDMYQVVIFGEPDYDPYTEEVIGHSREVIGKIKITEVERKLARARIISGEAVPLGVLEPISKPARKKASKVAKKPKPQPVTAKQSIVAPGGGVIL